MYQTAGDKMHDSPQESDLSISIKGTLSADITASARIDLLCYRGLSSGAQDTEEQT